MSAASHDGQRGQASADGLAIRHDPAAEDLDLLTVLEARARILEEFRASQQLIRQLASDSSRAVELAAARTRHARLEQTIDRLDHPAVRPPDLRPRANPDG
jgi:hypothetical protein